MSAPGAQAPCRPSIVAIGPVTSAAVAAHGREVSAEADPHSLAGLVEATVAALLRALRCPVVEALVFDLDGTIADTESVEYDAIRRVWADHGIDYPIERWSHVVGQAWSPSWVTELADEAGADPAASRAAKRAYHDDLLAALVLRPGVAALIAAAGDADIPMAIASNSDSAWVEGVLEQLGLLSHFLAVTTIDRVTQGKPHPEPFLAACRRLGARTGAVGGVRGLGDRRGLGRRRWAVHRRVSGSAHHRPRRRGRRPRRDLTRSGHAGLARGGGGGPDRRAGRTAARAPRILRDVPRPATAPAAPHAAFRRLVAETRLSVDDLVAPLFVREGIDEPQPIASLPGVVQHTRESLRKEVAELADLGVARRDPVRCPVPQGRRSAARPGTRRHRAGRAARPAPTRSATASC